MNNKEIINNYIKELNIKDVVELDNYNDFYKAYSKTTKRIYEQIVSSTIDKDKKFNIIFSKEYYKLRENILDTYRCYVKGDIQRASTKMYNILFRKKYYGKKFYGYFINTSIDNTMYRCRQGNVKEIEYFYQNIYHNMFHIAFNKRNLIGNCRFSISGFPCLYLGSSIECCQKELDCKNQKELAICTYKYREKLTFYDLTLSADNVDTLEELQVYLLKSLIVQAVSYTLNPIEKKTKDTKNFLTYYVVPQLITASIASYSKKTKERQCIRYRSVKFLNDRNQYNYVFIPKIERYKNDLNYDEKLFNKFEVELYNKSLVKV